jgi:uncharacterized protein
MNKKTVLIAGGSGFIGRHLSGLLKSSGYDVKILTRGATDAKRNLYHWDPANKLIDNQAFTNVNVVVNMAGAGISDKLWTPWRRRELVNSRLFSTRMLVELINKQDHKIEVFINASAIGIYGDTGLEIVHEGHPPGSNFLAKTCLNWEDEALKTNMSKTRLVVLRIGNVLAKNGGLFPTLMLSFRFRIALLFGTGEQYFSWIHMDDLCCLISECINNPIYNGTYNAVSPGFLSFKNLIVLIKQIMKKWYLTIKLPAPVLKLFLGGMSQLLTDGSRVSPEKIIQNGFVFKYSSAGKAFKDLLG